MTKLKKHEAALIIDIRTGEVSLLLPDHDEDDDISDGEVFLAALFAKCNDKAFRQPLIDELKKRVEEDDKGSDEPVIVPPTSH